MVALIPAVYAGPAGTDAEGRAIMMLVSVCGPVNDRDCRVLLKLNARSVEGHFAIRVLRGWGKRSRAALVFHLSAPHLDKPRPLGGPCLQYMQILNKGREGLDLVVAYRSHDYFQKAFGNFIGLSRLLAFIAAETRLRAGRLVCHSIHAFSSGSKKHLSRLIEEG